MNPKDLTIGDIKVGQSASFERAFTEADVLAFAKLSGDKNPLHIDETYARSTKLGRRVVYGMLLGSLCSTLVGMYIPGKRTLYLGQTLSFKKPVFTGDKIIVTGTVEQVSVSTGIVVIAVSMKKGEEEVVSGTATTQVLT